MWAPLSKSTNRLALFGALFCNALEWFDFAIYGLLATYISKIFFPSESASTALLATFALFGTSMAMRPLGALLIGYFGDVRGRKPALILSITLMAAGALTIGLLPTYNQIGIAAPTLLFFARLIQGFSAGGEWGVAIAFVAEWSPEGRRGLWCSFLAVSVALGSLVASGFIAVLVTLLEADGMLSYGWRIPFLLGGLFGVVGLWVRLKLDETPIQRKAGDAVKSVPAFRMDLRPGLVIFGVTIHWTVCYYAFLIYMPIYVQLYGHLSSVEAAWSNTIGLIVIILIVPIVGALSDRYGRRRFLLASCTCVAVLAIPAFVLVAETKSFAVVVVMQMILGIAIALYSGVAPALLAELLPTNYRSRWSAVPYAFAAAIFGGFAPFVIDWLIRETGSSLAPAAYVIAAALASLLVILHVRETFSVSLDQV